MPDTTRLFKCPTCGGPLEPPEGESAMKCPYCANTVIVPESLRVPARPAHGSMASGMDLHALGGQMAEVVRLVRDGNKIGAIKLYRELTGTSLQQAKEAVEAIERGESISLSSIGDDGQPQYAQQMATETVKVTRNIGRTLGCIVAVVVVFIILGTIIPIAIGMVSLGAGLSAILPSTRSAPPALPAALETALPGALPVAVEPEAVNSYATPVLTFGEQGTGPGMLDDPRAIAVARDGTIYTADYSDGRIQAFDAQGNFSKLINVGEDHYIQGLAVSGDGKLYAIYGGEAWIYDPQTGAPLGQFEYADDHYFDSLAIAADGKFVFASNGEDILVFNPDGSLSLSIPDSISTVSGDSELDTQIAVDGLGNIYALGSFNNAVFKYSPQGQYLNRFGGDGDGPGKFQAVDAIAVDGHGRVFVSDIWGVQVFDPDGAYLDRFGSTAEMGVVFGMAFDPQNYLYSATNKPEVVKFEVDSP